MATIDEIRKNRIKKMKDLRAIGINPYPIETKRTHSCQEVLTSFSKLSKIKKEIILVGRIRGIRVHGKATFLDLEDGGGALQLFLSEKMVGKKGYQFYLAYFDIGDFVEAKGTLFITKRKEKTMAVTTLKMLSKSLRPLPEKWHGLKDEEERLRKRYLDILFNPKTREIITKRALFWDAIRFFLKKRGFLEVETPALEIIAGGADAKPFETYHQAMGINLYLRISMGELWQKKLMIAGLEKTFEIGRQFRNEGLSIEHLQDYTQMEFYWAYADHQQGMKLIEELYRYVAKETFGTLKFKIRGFNIDLAKKWERYDYRSLISQQTGIDISGAGLVEIKKTLNKLGIKYDKKGFNRNRAIDNLWKYCRKKIAGPGFLINVPIELSPLAKRNKNHPETAAKFQVILAGSELGNGYSELNDPIDQAERFKEQQVLRDKGDEEAQMFDYDFVEALEYGMPPTCGFGLSERLFSFLMNLSARECQIFPLMKPK